MEMLCFDQKIDAEEAKQRGLVTNVFPHMDFKAECMRRLNLFATKPASTLEATKRLIRQREIEQMLKLSISFVSFSIELLEVFVCLMSRMFGFDHIFLHYKSELIIFVNKAKWELSFF